MKLTKELIDAIALGKRIKYVRKELAHKTQEDFAFSLYVSRVYISQLENAKTEAIPNDAFFNRICEQYGVSFEWLVFGYEPILQTEVEENKKIEDYYVQYYLAPEMKLYYREHLQNHYQSELNLGLKELLDPGTHSPEQYAKLIDSFVTLSSPLFRFCKALKANYLQDETSSNTLYQDYLDELKATIKVFFSS